MADEETLSTQNPEDTKATEGSESQIKDEAKTAQFSDVQPAGYSDRTMIDYTEIVIGAWFSV